MQALPTSVNVINGILQQAKATTLLAIIQLSVLSLLEQNVDSSLSTATRLSVATLIPQ